MARGQRTGIKKEQFAGASLGPHLDDDSTHRKSPNQLDVATGEMIILVHTYAWLQPHSGRPGTIYRAEVHAPFRGWMHATQKNESYPVHRNCARPRPYDLVPSATGSCTCGYQYEAQGAREGGGKHIWWRRSWASFVRKQRRPRCPSANAKESLSDSYDSGQSSSAQDEGVYIIICMMKCACGESLGPALIFHVRRLQRGPGNNYNNDS